jgi:hypothetical protein
MERRDGKLTFFLLVSWFNVPNQLFYASILSPQILCCLLLLRAPPSCPVSQQLGEVVKKQTQYVKYQVRHLPSATSHWLDNSHLTS